MANSAQARKRARQNETRRRHNASQRSMFRTYLKKVDAAINARDAQDAATALQTAIPVIDKMVSRGIIRKNKAARHKSRLTAKVKALASG